jgi:hypothetical protein
MKIILLSKNLRIDRVLNSPDVLEADRRRGNRSIEEDKLEAARIEAAAREANTAPQLFLISTGVFTPLCNGMEGVIV